VSASVLVTGGNGMLALAVGKVFGENAKLFPKNELDIRDGSAFRSAIQGFDFVINTAAYTSVDEAETNEELAHELNAKAVVEMATACREAGIRFIQISTDYVFGETEPSPIPENARTNPVSAYGRTKLAGERLALAAHPGGTSVVRTAWLYGAGGKSFVKTMSELAVKNEAVSVVTDQIGQPTWTIDVAERLKRLLDAPAGVYHATNSGAASWFDLAKAVYEIVGADQGLVKPTDTASFERPAKRPAYSVLGDEAALNLGLPPMRDWREALAEAMRVDFDF
jgi:dTDP-4-dehydrorhamnose reductase